MADPEVQNIFSLEGSGGGGGPLFKSGKLS